MRQNQELGCRLIEQMEHQHSDREEPQEGAHLRPEMGEGFREERQDGDQDPGTSAP